MIGRTLAHYRILEKIGEGGMGEVYLAEDLKLHRKVAVKVLPAKLVGDEDRRLRFLQEAESAAAVDHPHIASIYDVGEADGTTFLAMEYIRGRSLRRLLVEGPVPPSLALKLAGQIADALARVHENGVIHRDLKPENILIGDGDYAKILDFGLAKLVQRSVPAGGSQMATRARAETADGVILGTVDYMSPEQTRGEEVDFRSDIFSFGVVLQEMLSGKSPFRRATGVETMNAILVEPAPSPTVGDEEAPDEVQRILGKALAKDPAQRYQSTSDLALDVRAFRERQATGVVVPPDRVRSRRGRTIAIAAGLGVVVVATLLLLFSGIFRGRPEVIGSSGRPSIAVMTFASPGDADETRWLSRGLPSMLVTDLAQTPGLDVVSSQRVHEVAARMGQGDTIDPGLVMDVARRAGAGAMVVGSIFQSGDQIRIDVQVEEVGTGRVLFAESVRGTDVFPLVDELSGRIRRGLDLPGVGNEREISQISTDSLEAYRLYTEALDARRNMRFQDALGGLEEAVRIDPNFAMALHEISRFPEGFVGRHRVEDYRKRVLANLDRLPERRRLGVRADEAARREEFPEAIRTLEHLLDLYPDEEEGYLRLAEIQGRAFGDAAAVRGVMERGVRELPGSGPIHNKLGYALLHQGLFDEALAEFQTYADLKPEEPNPHDSQGEVYLRSGRPEQALEAYQRALDRDPTFFQAHGGRAFSFAAMGRYDEWLAETEEIAEQLKSFPLGGVTVNFMRGFGYSRVGRYEAALEASRECLRTAGELGMLEGQVWNLLLQSLIALERGTHDLARERALQALAMAGTVEVAYRRQGLRVLSHLLAGINDARAGDLESARAHLSEQREIHNPDSVRQYWWVHALEGEIALAEGEPVAALEAFNAGEPEFQMWYDTAFAAPLTLANSLPFREGRARALAAMGDREGAIEAYRKLLTPSRDQKWTAMLEPRFVLALARLLGDAGEPDAARAEYQRFLELWKDADPDLPELAEARNGSRSAQP